MRRTKQIITLLALSLSLGATACGKKGKGKDTTTPGGVSSGVNANNPETASAEAKASFEEVAARYRTAKARGPLSKGTCADLSGEFEKVYKKFGAQMAVAKFNAGAVMEECGDVEAAEKHYEQLVQQVPKYDLAYNNLGVIAWNRRQEGRALDYFKKAVEANSTTKAPRNNLAAALRDKYTDNPQQSDFDAAEKQLQTVLAVDSSNRLAYENLARLYYDRGRLKDKSYLLLADLVTTQAVRVFKDAGVDSADIWNIKGLLLMERDNQVEALRAFKKAVEVDKKHTDANMNIAMIALRFRDFKSAEESINIALTDKRQKKNVEAYLGLGTALRGQRKYGDAEKAFKKALDVKSSDPRALYNLGILYHEHIGPESERKNETDTFDKKPYQTAVEYFNKFTAQASSKKELQKYSDDAKNRVTNIQDYFKNIEEMKKLEAEAKKLEELAKKQEAEEKARLLKMEEDMRKQQGGGAAPAATPPASTPPADKGAEKPKTK
ncbi:MAG: tetratricopeptide repeat protein [Deltaproteobacteria bacterium]|nr:tetratricopeptide repeat protein [Nannocystaceae bacterium]